MLVSIFRKVSFDYKKGYILNICLLEIMKDRLLEYRLSRQEVAPDDSVAVIDLPNGDLALSEFLTQVDEIRDSLDKISEKVHNLRKVYSSMIVAPVLDQNVKDRKKYLEGSITNQCKEVKSFLQKIDKDLKSMEESGDITNSVEIRAKRAQLSTLSGSFIALMSDYNTVQSEYKDKCKTKLRRQSEISGRSLSETDIENRYEAGEVTAFANGIITDPLSARKVITDLEKRQSDIHNLETSMKELHDMFTDMAVIIASQGDLVDSIEVAVELTTDYITSAVTATKKAVVYQKQARRKVFILLAICVLFLLVMVLIFCRKWLK